MRKPTVLFTTPARRADSSAGVGVYTHPHNRVILTVFVGTTPLTPYAPGLTRTERESPLLEIKHRCHSEFG